MQTFNWENLDLSAYEAPRVSNALAPGRYHVKVTKCEQKPTKAGDGAGVQVEYEEVGGNGKTQEYISLFTSSIDEGKLKAIEIGRGRLKALLAAAQHPSPDKPGLFAPWLVGRTIGLIVEQSEDWTDDKGVTRRGGGKPTQRGSAYFLPGTMAIGKGVGVAEASPARQGNANGAAAKGAAKGDDGIPF